MCGIAGILRFDGQPCSEETVRRLTEMMSHRGPDGAGYLVQGPLGLGHRRLAIIDLESGKQPMSNEDEKIWLTFNGEIYNYRELQVELQKRGHIFRTKSDSEVIIHSYETWGEDCVQHFRGMFAFAIADFRRRQLFLARDHFGIKPLFYRLTNEAMLFASELNALTRVADMVQHGNLSAVEYFLRYGYIPAPTTIYRDISKLPPAHSLTVPFEGREGKPRRYWGFQFQGSRNVPSKDWESVCTNAIEESVESHLVSDVPFGVFLSGGIDSTLVAAAMSKLLERGVDAFCIGFGHDEASEIPFARQVALKYGINLHVRTVEQIPETDLRHVLGLYGEPFGDSSAIPTWYVSRFAREYVPMVLSGDGGDETFGGYDTYCNWADMGPPSKHLCTATSMIVEGHPRASLRALGRGLTAWQAAFRGTRSQLWQKMVSITSAQDRRRLWQPHYQYLADLGCQAFTQATSGAKGSDYLGYAQYCDYQTYLPDSILAKVDVASMAHGLEVRTPLLDRQVLSMASLLPAALRTGPGTNGCVTGKTLLRKILSRSFDDDFANRGKCGFGLPRKAQFLPEPKRLREILLGPDSCLMGLFCRSAIEELLQSTAHDQRFKVVWLLLCLQIWLEMHPHVSFS